MSLRRNAYLQECSQNKKYKVMCAYCVYCGVYSMTQHQQMISFIYVPVYTGTWPAKHCMSMTFRTWYTLYRNMSRGQSQGISGSCHARTAISHDYELHC